MCFSPTGTTKKTVKTISDSLAKLYNTRCESINFTLPEAREKEYTFSKGDIVVFGVPVYAGRVPNVLLKFLTSKVSGNGAFAVPVVLFGNRNYDDALIELCGILEKDGFIIASAGAFVGEHSFSYSLGKGRPNEDDLNKAITLSEMTYKRIGENCVPSPLKVKGETPIRPYYTPRDRHGNPINILKVKPKTAFSCTSCGKCANLCPMGSISKADPKVITGICIKCCACVKGCPVHAKYFDDKGYVYHKTELEDIYSRPAESEIF